MGDPDVSAGNDDARALQAVHLSDVTLASEAVQRGFYERVMEQALAAEAKAGAVERWFNIAGANLRVTFAGETLIGSFLPSLASLEVRPAGHHDAWLHVWDSGSTGIGMVPPICPREHFSNRGDIWSLLSRRYRSAFHMDDGHLSLFDIATDTGVHWVHAADLLSDDARACPWRDFLHWWMEARGCQLVAGSALGRCGTGIWVLGANDSRQALISSGRAAGLTLLADGWMVRESASSSRAFPLSAPAGNSVQPFELKAVVLAQAAQAEPGKLAPVDNRLLQRLASFAATTQLPHANLATIAAIESLIATLPAYRLDPGNPGAAGELVMLLEHGLETTATEPVRRHPLVSVIIPVRNGAHFLADAIASIEAQDYRPIEVIVVDDGSTDDVESALIGGALNLRYIRQAPSGPSAARNHGIREAQGELIAFLDVDDLWPRGNLPVLLAEMLSDRSCDVVHGYAQLLRHICDSGTYEFVGNPLEVFHDYLGGALYRRSAFERVGLLDEKLAYFEDVDWFYRARDEGLVVSRLPLVSLYVRRHEANLTHGGTQREFSFAALKKIMARKRRRAGETGTGLANLP